MKKYPLITVYITNYNYENFIRTSIESVLNQSLQDFELLIIDDGSKDNSKSIIEEYREYEKVTIIYQKNKGLNITNNVAMRAAKGKYIMRLDADDFLENEALQVMADILENDNNLGLVFPDYYYVDVEGTKIGEERRHNFKEEVSLFDQPAHGACTMIRLEYLKRLGGYNESFNCQDGFDLWIKFITHYQVTNINKPLFSYRRHGNNLTTNENRILSTRQKIKDAFVDKYFKTSLTLAIIPVRNNYINGENWPLYRVNNKSILEHKIDVCLNSNKIEHLAITSSDKEILEFCFSKYDSNTRISIIERPKKFEDPNQSLSNSIENVLDYLSKLDIYFEAVMTVSLEYPFLNSEAIDEVINTQVLFNSDSVISVRPDNKMYYRHTGSGMVPILDQDKFTKFEREALYKGAGGLMLTTINQFSKTRKSVSGNVSHVIVDKKISFGVFDAFDFEVFERLSKSISSVS